MKNLNLDESLLPLWKEYSDAIKERNDKHCKEIMALNAKIMSEHKTEFNLEKKKYKEEKKRLDDQIARWEKLPWYKRNFIDRPYKFIERPYPFVPGIIWPFLERITIEDFMDWLVKKSDTKEGTQ